VEELCWLDALELAAAIREKKVSPVEVIDAHLKRIARENPKVNAIVTLTADLARAEAKKAEESVLKGEQLGPLHGVPVLVKDNVFTKGIRTTFGSRLYEDFVPEEDAVLVERLKVAGAIVMGKTNIPEFGLVCVTDNLVFGHTGNPWDIKKTPGGSSGGAAAAVALGLSPLATGNDAGGSIRIPASLCGVFGLKPSFGRIPSYPRLPGFETLSHEGPITRSVADAALMLEVMAGPYERDRLTLPAAIKDYVSTLDKGVNGLRVAYSPDLGYAEVEPEVRDITYQGALAFRELGCEVEETDVMLPDMVEAMQSLVVPAIVAANEDRLEEWKQKIYPAFRPMLTRAGSISSRDTARAEFKKDELWQKVTGIFEKYDLLLTPASAVTAFDSGKGGPIGPTEINGRRVRGMSWTAFAYPFNFTGQPAASVPCGFSKAGLPVGLQIVGRRFDENTVLRAAAAFEKIRPWRQRRPIL
jgi:Asp-tRNA(Asn)/Glu-tRNA(Gln) amidotransferase A subunit family amidase